MYMHPSFYYLFISPFETNPYLGEAWKIIEFPSIVDAMGYIKKYDLTKCWKLYKFDNILELMDKDEEDLND